VVQVIRHFWRRDGVLLHVVEAAAMHVPQFAEHAATALVRIRWRFQAVVERNEIKRFADPRNGGDDVKPAQGQVQPVSDKAFHETPPLLIRCARGGELLPLRTRPLSCPGRQCAARADCGLGTLCIRLTFDLHGAVLVASVGRS
jgi:hypothetical protein